MALSLLFNNSDCVLTSVIYSEEATTFVKCSEFIKFGNQTSFKTCGSVLKYSREGNPRQLLGIRTFLTNKRQLTIRIHTDKTLADNNFGWQEIIAVELVITSHHLSQIVFYETMGKGDAEHPN